MPRHLRGAAALLSAVVVLLLLQAPPLSSQQLQQPCNLGFQRTLLLMTYNNTLATKGGWRFNQGWADAWAKGPRTWTQLNYTCKRPGVALLLPDYCCWHGITCCTEAACQPGAIDPTICNCQVGAVTSISLANSNVTISTTTMQGPNPLACSLRSLSLHSTFLLGDIPAHLVTVLTQLEYLDLSSNRLGSTLPSRFVPSLKVINLMGNRLVGSVPSLCREGAPSPLTDLKLGDNRLTGSLDVSWCSSLVSLEAQNNQLTSSVTNPAGLRSVRTLYLGNNNLTGHVARHLAGARSLTDLQMAGNALTGPVPEEILLQNLGLMFLNLANNRLTGTVSSDLFIRLNTLVDMDLTGNQLTGTIPPEIGLSGFLNSLLLANNKLTGTIPAEVFGLPQTGRYPSLDLRGNPLSCCLLNVSHSAEGMHTFLGYLPDFSILPRGVEFSTQYRILEAERDELEGLSCPYMRLSSQRPDERLHVLVDPEYYLYQGCVCRQGYSMLNNSRPATPGTPGVMSIHCIPVAPSPVGTDGVWLRQPWIIVLVGIGSLALIGFIVWLYHSRARPALQNLMEMHKRAKGMPVDGMVSIVVTDIEDFTELFRRHPEVMLSALHIHNDIIRKCRWQNYGFPLEEEGDSYSLIFSEAADAVKFSLQVQQALNRANWPSVLVDTDTALYNTPSKIKTDSSHHGKHEARHVDGPQSSSPRIVGSLLSRWGGTATRRSKGKAGPDTPRPSLQVETSTHSLPQLIDSSVDGKQGTGLYARGSLQAVKGHSRFDRQASGSPGEGREREGHVGNLFRADSGDVQRQMAEREQSWLYGRLPTALRTALTNRTGLFQREASAHKQKATYDHKPEVFKGLRVRIGIATGVVPPGMHAGASPIMDLAKLISDTASGGQTLMCSNTFWDVQHRAWELGCVNHEGLDNAKLQASKPFPWSRRQRVEEALLLDMGTHVRMRKDLMMSSLPDFMPRPTIVPLIMDPSYLGNMSVLTGKAETNPSPSGRRDMVKRTSSQDAVAQVGVRFGEDRSARNGRANAALLLEGEAIAAPPTAPSVPPGLQRPGAGAQQLALAGVINSPFHRMSMLMHGSATDRNGSNDKEEQQAGGGCQAEQQQRLHLYQVLPPVLAARGPALGSRLRLRREEWEALDVPYFDAPGAQAAPLRALPTERFNIFERLPKVTLVFCCVEGARQFTTFYRKCSRNVHRELVAMMYSVLRQVPGGYFVKHQIADLKYMLAFSSPEMALLWCTTAQECALHLDYPPSALRNWPEELDSEGNVVFRGPRLKMGITTGRPTSIHPDCLGRADYHGESINLAARIMDGAAQGGQVVCEQSLAERVLGSWTVMQHNTELQQQQQQQRQPSMPAPPGFAEAAQGLMVIQEHGDLWSEGGPSTAACSQDGRSLYSFALGAAAEGPLSGPDAMMQLGTPAAGHRQQGRQQGQGGQQERAPGAFTAKCQASIGAQQLGAEAGGASSGDVQPSDTDVVPSNTSGLSSGATEALPAVSGQALGTPGLPPGVPGLPLSPKHYTSCVSGVLSGANGLSSGTNGQSSGTYGFGSSATKLSHGISGVLSGASALSSGANAAMPAGPSPSAFSGPLTSGTNPPGAELGAGLLGISRLGSDESTGGLPLLSAEVVEAGAMQDVHALRLGAFRFKGVSGEVPLVHLTTTKLLGRRFSTFHARGKGALVAEGHGVVASAPVPLLRVLSAYRQKEAQRMAMQRPQATQGSHSAATGAPPPLGVGRAPGPGTLLQRASHGVCGPHSSAPQAPPGVPTPGVSALNPGRRSSSFKAATTSPSIPTSSPDIPTTSPSIPTLSPDIPTTSPSIPTTTSSVPTSPPSIPTATPSIPTSTPGIPTLSPSAATLYPAAPSLSPSGVIATIERTNPLATCPLGCGPYRELPKSSPLSEGKTLQSLPGSTTLEGEAQEVGDNAIVQQEAVPEVCAGSEGQQ